MPELPRLLVIMGSGETSPTMSRTHRELFARLGPPPVPAVLLDTPVGFQENADEITARALAYFRESVGREIEVASFRSAQAADAVQHETMLNRLRAARYVFAGPGSPSYALEQWSGTAVPEIFVEKLRTGGCLTFASAAAVTLGPFALPVYEIYKVGKRPHWLPGLDVTSRLGLPAVVIPHFDNAEGRAHDTRYCYMGERRLSVLEAMLPDDVFILGVDEHTVCIVDLGAGRVTVDGLGSVTVRHRGAATAFPTGTTVSAEALCLAGQAGRVEHVGDRVQPDAAVAPLPGPAPERSPFPAEVGRLERQFGSALDQADARAAVATALELERLLVDWSHDTLESEDLDRGRAALRSLLVRLGEAAEVGLRDPREVVGPFVEALLEQRDRARRDRRWAEADAIRDRLAEAGVQVRDTPGGTRWQLGAPGRPAAEGGGGRLVS